jgi:hypothetical protein
LVRFTYRASNEKEKMKKLILINFLALFLSSCITQHTQNLEGDKYFELAKRFSDEVINYHNSTSVDSSCDAQETSYHKILAEYSELNIKICHVKNWEKEGTKSCVFHLISDSTNMIYNDTIREFIDFRREKLEYKDFLIEVNYKIEKSTDIPRLFLWVNTNDEAQEPIVFLYARKD